MVFMRVSPKEAVTSAEPLTTPEVSSCSTEAYQAEGKSLELAYSPGLPQSLCLLTPGPPQPAREPPLGGDATLVSPAPSGQGHACPPIPQSPSSPSQPFIPSPASVIKRFRGIKTSSHNSLG